MAYGARLVGVEEVGWVVGRSKGSSGSKSVPGSFSPSTPPSGGKKLEGAGGGGGGEESEDEDESFSERKSARAAAAAARRGGDGLVEWEVSVS